MFAHGSALTLLEVQQWNRALQLCEQVLELDGQNQKALARKARALMELSRLHEAECAASAQGWWRSSEWLTLLRHSLNRRVVDHAVKLACDIGEEGTRAAALERLQHLRSLLQRRRQQRKRWQRQEREMCARMLQSRVGLYDVRCGCRYAPGGPSPAPRATG